MWGRGLADLRSEVEMRMKKSVREGQTVSKEVDGSLDAERSNVTDIVRETDPQGKHTIFVLTEADMVENKSVKPKRVGWDTLHEEFQRIIEEDKKRKDHDDIFDQLKMAVVATSKAKHQWESKAEDIGFLVMLYYFGDYIILLRSDQQCSETTETVRQIQDKALDNKNMGCMSKVRGISKDIQNKNNANL
ncbi:OPA1 [Mytilus edulis]|uniref:OPA1 n=1 Tax=Mytilus edulis TaxID=6550 RepID=A0A8S3VJ29_MYTED|nr:OPA1 [Mytilus edulis]